MDNSEIKRILTEQNWEELTTRLTFYALMAIKNWRWQGEKGRWKDPKECLLPGGMGPDDMVNEAVARICQGDRRWDPLRHPDLFQYLKGVIDSLINAIMEGSFNKCERRSEVIVNEDGTVASMLDFTSDGRPDPREQWEIENGEFIPSFHDFLADEPQLQKIVDIFMEWDAMPKEIAERLGIPVKEVNNLQKKLRRRATEFRKIWDKRATKVDTEVERG